MTPEARLPRPDLGHWGRRGWARRCWSPPTRTLWLHGFAGASTTWSPVLEQAPGLGGQAWDLPGHGQSQAWSRSEGGLEAAAAALAAALVEAEGPEAWCVVGYSLGARLALHLALVAPQVVGSLCLLGGDPGLPLEGIEARWHQDQRWASLLQSEGWDPFSKEWEALPLFQGLHRMPAESLSRWRAWRAQANPEPSLLAETLLAFSPARQASLWPELRRITAPTWWVAGAEDAKYAALVPRAAAAQGPQAQVQLVPGCTHALPIEAPAAVAAIVRHAQEGAKRRRQSPPLAAGGSA